jgi:hypothetical protein
MSKRKFPPSQNNATLSNATREKLPQLENHQLVNGEVVEHRAQLHDRK